MAACRWCVPGFVAAALGAAVLGGLGAWLYLRLCRNADDRASHRIDELRERLDQLSQQLSDYARDERRSGEISA